MDTSKKKAPFVQWTGDIKQVNEWLNYGRIMPVLVALDEQEDGSLKVTPATGPIINVPRGHYLMKSGKEYIAIESIQSLN